MLTKNDLIAFENEVARRYEAGEICGPVHLGGGSEDQLIEIFKGISPEDWKLCAWRSHHAALLSGIPPDELMRQILAGRSMYVNSIEHRFYSSSIAGGILPIAVGLGMGIKRKDEARKVFVFCGDMVAQMGIFYESVKYARNFDLPVMFIVENNHRSVLTDTEKVWNGSEGLWAEYYSNVREYEYELSWPHSGVKQLAGF